MCQCHIWKRCKLSFNKLSDYITCTSILFRRCSYNGFLLRACTSHCINNPEVLKVAIIGPPNAGKSTIINEIVGRRVLAMSKKVHTTISCAKAVFNEGNKQIIFLDTPGLVTIKEFEKYNLNPSFLRGGEDAIVQADIVGVVQDLSVPHYRTSLDSKVLRLLYLHQHKDSFLILNKIDTIKSKRQLLDISQQITRGKLKSHSKREISSQNLSELEVKKLIEHKKQLYWEEFGEVFMVSALLGSGMHQLKNYLLQRCRPGEWIFPPDIYTDKGPVKIIEEVVRSKLLENLPQEIPYGLDVQLEYLDTENEDRIFAVVLIGCSTDRLLGRIKGFGGKRIKSIAFEAEQELADAFLSDVCLKLVIVKKEIKSEISTYTVFFNYLIKFYFIFNNNTS